MRKIRGMIRKVVFVWLAVVIDILPLSAQLVYSWDQTVAVDIEGSKKSMAWAGGLNAPQLSTMDLNSDGTEDLVIFDRTSDKLSTFLVYSASKEYAPEYENLFPPDLIGWVLLRDFNCDGKKDLFANTAFGIKVYENTTPPGGQLAWQLIADPIMTKGSSGQINLQVNVQDIPGIDDLDGDGDLDILVYNFATGGGIEFHENLSVDTNGSCGILFERMTRRWGDFDECDCDSFVFGTELCEDLNSTSRLKHIGGKSILNLDIDNDGDKEIVIGQEDCSFIGYLENEGTAQDALMTDFTNQFPFGANNTLDSLDFPALYYEDVDFDGIPDLLASTNYSFNQNNSLDFQSSFWFYKNIGSEELPIFEYSSKDFLQRDMIDLGEEAFPVFTDFDRDGDSDLFISHKGSADKGSLTADIWFFENIGAGMAPEFKLINKDFLNLSSLKLSHLSLQFADLNEDGNPDFVLMGSGDGITSTLFYIFNESSKVYSFDPDQIVELSQEFNSEDRFHLAQIGGNNLPDLLIGRNSGRLDYFRNNGSSNAPSFILDSGEFYGIDDDFSRRNLSVTTADLDADGLLDLLTIDERGILIYYFDFLNTISNPGPGSELLFSDQAESGSPFNHKMGNRAGISTSHLFPAAEPSIILGLESGGVQILRNVDASALPPINENELQVIAYPNPIIGQNNGFLSVTSSEAGQVQIITYLGQEASLNYPIQPGRPVQFDTSTLPSGLYLLKTHSNQGKVKTHQIVVYN